MPRKSSDRIPILTLILVVSQSLICAHRFTPVVSMSGLEKARHQLQMSPFHYYGEAAGFARRERSLASGRWGLRPGKRSSLDDAWGVDDNRMGLAEDSGNGR